MAQLFFPGALVLVEPTPIVASMLPPNPDFPMIRGRTGTQDKETLEKTWSRRKGRIKNGISCTPVLLGESIAPFRVLTPQQAVIPWDVEGHGTNLDLDINPLEVLHPSKAY